MSGNLAMDSHAPAFLSVHDIHAYYGESYIVQGVSFNVHEGEILALLGRNGAGKTSTLRTIARLDDPALVKGEIWLDHKHLHTMSSHEAAVNGIATYDHVGHTDTKALTEQGLKVWAKRKCNISLAQPKPEKAQKNAQVTA